MTHVWFGKGPVENVCEDEHKCAFHVDEDALLEFSVWLDDCPF